jgi:two-component system response regulator YesN
LVEYLKSSFQHGAVDHILKPSLNPAELIKTLKKASSKIQNLTLHSKGAINANNMLNTLKHDCFNKINVLNIMNS